MDFRICTISCSNHHHLILEHFCHPKRIAVAMEQLLLNPLCPQSPTTHNLFSDSVETFGINGVIHVVFCVVFHSASCF